MAWQKGDAAENGIAEADETVFLVSFKGTKQELSRAPRQRSGKVSKRGMSEEQTPVLIYRDRTGSTAGRRIWRSLAECGRIGDEE
jgi:hypothetical protein